MATFSKTTALSSRKYISEQGISIPDSSKKNRFFGSHSSVFALEKQPKYPNFQSFVPLRNPLVAPFIETGPPASRKYVSEQGIAMLNWSKTFQTFSSYSSVFPLQKQPKNLNFRNFSLPENIYLNQARSFQINQTNFSFFGCTPAFLL